MSEVTGCKLWVIAWEEVGQVYVYGSNPRMVEKGDPYRYEHCDLRRYPEGVETEFNNKVILYESPVRYSSADGALRSYLKDRKGVLVG